MWKKRGGEQNALTGLVFCADLSLAREERREKLAAVVGPARRLRTERKHHAVVRVERKVLDRVEGDGELRQPDGLVGGLGRTGIRVGRRSGIQSRNGAASVSRVVVVAQGIVAAAGDELDAAGKMNAVLHDGGGLVAVFPQAARAGGLERALRWEPGGDAADRCFQSRRRCRPRHPARCRRVVGVLRQCRSRAAARCAGRARRRR